MGAGALPGGNNLTQGVVGGKAVADVEDAVEMVGHDLIMEHLNAAAGLLCRLDSRLTEGLRDMGAQRRRLDGGSGGTVTHQRTQKALAAFRRHRDQIDAGRGVVVRLHSPQAVVLDRGLYHCFCFLVFFVRFCSFSSRPVRPVLGT